MGDGRTSGTGRQSGSGTPPSGRPGLGAVLPALIVLAAAALLVVGIVGIGRIDAESPDWATDQTGEPAAPPRNQFTDMPTLEPREEMSGDDTPSGFNVPWEAALAVLAALIVVAGVILLRRLPWLVGRRARSVVVGGQVDEIPDSVEDLRRAVQSAGAALERDGTAGRDAVIEAWLTLESAAAESGAPRRPSQTPSEFTSLLLRRHHADAAATTHLRDLYHRARFARDPEISANDVALARDALRTILSTLDTPGGPAAPASAGRAGPDQGETP